MICPECYGCGCGIIGDTFIPSACHECHGSGVVYCCDKAGANDLSEYPVAVTVADYCNWALRQHVDH